MKKALLTLAIVLLVVAARAQIKVHDDGQVSLGTLSTSYGVQVKPSDYTSFRSQKTNDWSYVEQSKSTVTNQKHWVVKDLRLSSNSHTFFVTTGGNVYKRGSWRVADGNSMFQNGIIEDAGAVLDSIMGVWYIPVDEESGGTKSEGHRRVGVVAQDLERVIPEAVTADENGLLYVDYEALTVFLIEAVKDQRQEILLLRKTLEENGLMESEKP